MKNEKTAYIISHSHWDREWYMSLEEHRYYLVKLVDDLLELLDEDPDFHSFHMDGQTIMIDDYLQVRPGKSEKVKKYIREGRLIVGPWYILQDAFLTSSEANVRNLFYGMKETKKLGQEGKIGYFPDTFGIYGQAPQLLKQASIDVATFGRGVTPTGFNNQVHHLDDYASPYSELVWESPDGSSVLGVLFANWYSNGNEIPEDREKAKAFWEKKLTEAEKFASTSHLLFMNGCDHQPVQKNITKAIKQANELYPSVSFKHTSFQDYLMNVKKDLPHTLQEINGELRNQKTDGWSTLVNTASSRIYLKRANDRCQTLLERVVEPIGLLANNKQFFNDFSEYYWKLLMENHPHDSICGCSVDSVHREMVTRFEKVEKGATKLVDEQCMEIASTINTNHPIEDAIPMVLFHTSGQPTSKVVTEKVQVKKIYFDEMDFRSIPGKLKSESLPSYHVELADGSVTSVQIKDLGVRFGYDLPNDQFRKPYYAREVEVTFFYQTNVHVGYECCFLVPDEAPLQEGETVLMWNQDKNSLENEHIVVDIHPNGSYSLTNKQTHETYNRLGIYENTGDIGNEYMYKQSGDGEVLTTENASASVQILEDSPYVAKVAIHTSFSVPKEADENLQTERENLVWHPERRSGRSLESTDITIKTQLLLEKQAKGLKVEVEINNTAKDHRLRALFPVGKQNVHHYADSIFEIAKRPNEPEKEWKNPSVDHHMQRFVSLNDEQRGLTIATKGLHEYEILNKDTIAVTLLRSVGEMGDWGVFESPEAQCLRINKAEFMIIPHEDSVLSSHAYLTAYDYPFTPTMVQVSQQDGVLPNVKSLFTWEGEGLVLTTSKQTDDGSGMILRWFNPTSRSIPLTVDCLGEKAVYESNIIEEKKEKVTGKLAGQPVNPYEIVTFLVEADVK
ncbi:alpha-mannosidase [Alteribacter populi]|uniref:alpha-mannosidase n=1 Tax=Alteribacter populi TaxID=2011011 RepID=UPI000BBB4FE3|nr:alpha-mannosidase [Alteribacter populi]